MSKHCVCCGQLFDPCPQVPKQAYCSSTDCQRSRKRRWQQNKLETDPDYRGNQQDAQRAWHDRNPDYWRKYRESHPEYVQQNRARQRQVVRRDSENVLANMDLSMLRAGLYRVKVLVPAVTDQDGVWIVSITPMKRSPDRKKDVSKERT